MKRTTLRFFDEGEFEASDRLLGELENVNDYILSEEVNNDNIEQMTSAIFDSLMTENEYLTEQLRLLESDVQQLSETINELTETLRGEGNKFLM